LKLKFKDLEQISKENYNYLDIKFSKILILSKEKMKLKLSKDSLLIMVTLLKIQNYSLEQVNMLFLRQNSIKYVMDIQ